MADEPEIAPAPDPAEQLPTDRPVQNVVGEFSRKFGRLEQTVGQLAQAVGTILERRQTPPPPPKGGEAAGVLSDDELWERAKAGDKAAFDEHQQRKAAQVYKEMRAGENHEALVAGQLQILHSKYPLNDPQQPLTQTAQAAYALLTRRGYPATQATYLEAVKTAIADRPDLVAELHTQGARAREGARRVSAGHAGVTGTTYRQEEPSAPGKVRVTPEQSALAKRMNVSDPAKAIERFMRRQETGESRFGAVAGSLQQNGEF